VTVRVDIRGVGRRFGSTVALADVDLMLPSGSRTALLGPNGSGKSTLMRAILGLVGHTGTITFDGRPRTDEDATFARAIAYVPQVAPRLAATLDDLVRATCALRGMTSAGFVRTASTLGLDAAALGRRPLRDLSGGMRQKALAALALAAEPRLLVLDEPTASMDAESRQRFFALVDALPATTTVVLCSHRLDELRSLVDRVAVLAEGRLVFCGSAATFLAATGGSVVEVRATAAGEAHLRRLQFTRRCNGQWTRTTAAGERAALVAAVVDRLGSELVDILVHDQQQPFTAGVLPIEAGAASAPLPLSVSHAERHAS